MKTVALMLLIAIATYYVASWIQTVLHRFFVPARQCTTRCCAILFITLVCAAYCLLPGIYFIAHLCGVTFAIGWRRAAVVQTSRPKINL